MVVVVAPLCGSRWHSQKNRAQRLCKFQIFPLELDAFNIDVFEMLNLRVSLAPSPPWP